MKAFKHWQVVENVVAAVELASNRMPGMRLRRNVVIPSITPGAKGREVDILVELPIGKRTINLVVEVKAHTQPLSIVEMEQLAAKKTKLPIDRFCVVTLAGVSEEAQAEADRCGIELLTLEQVHESDWFKVAHFKMHMRNFEAKTIQLGFPPDAMIDQELLGSTSLAGSDILFVDFNDKKRAASELLTSHVIQHFNRIEKKRRTSEHL